MHEVQQLQTEQSSDYQEDGCCFLKKIKYSWPHFDLTAVIQVLLLGQVQLEKKNQA